MPVCREAKLAKKVELQTQFLKDHVELQRKHIQAPKQQQKYQFQQYQL